MLVSKLVAAVVFATGVAGASLVASGNKKAEPEQAAPVSQAFEIVEAVGWDAGPGAPTEL